VSVLLLVVQLGQSLNARWAACRADVLACQHVCSHTVPPAPTCLSAHTSCPVPRRLPCPAYPALPCPHPCRCPICIDMLEQPSVTPCDHWFCRQAHARPRAKAPSATGCQLSCALRVRLVVFCLQHAATRTQQQRHAINVPASVANLPYAPPQPCHPPVPAGSAS
jgi:hypothetical protein